MIAQLIFLTRFLAQISDSWEDKHFFSFILDKVLAVNNKRNQLKIKGFTAQNNQ